MTAVPIIESLHDVVSRLGDVIVSLDDRPASRPELSINHGAAVRLYQRARRLRDRFFPAELFADPSWDILIDLYAARQTRRPVSVSGACYAAAAPSTTGLRHIALLQAAGLIERTPDPADHRRTFLVLTPKGLDAMRDYLAAVASLVAQDASR